MNVIDLVAVIVVCVTVIAIYLLERALLARMRTDAAMHARNAHESAQKAALSAHFAEEKSMLSNQHAQRSFASAERSQTVADKDRAKIESRLASLEAGRRQ